ncbi:MAG TPA: hypothetical protein VLF91_04795 [Candidatus Saccharimonadales bacterium]|nr:hypothetical protein [Candidatus Saccharimonadales bacterium]
MAPSAATPAASSRPPQLKLPALVFGAPEVRRLRREVELLDEFMRQSGLRAPGTQPKLPRLSRLCEAMAAENNMNLLLPEHRTAMTTLLTSIETGAPRVHMSFAADPSSAFTSRMVAWLRQNVHPFTLLDIGLQPSIAAGCIVRTTNKQFDFSLRERFTGSVPLLMQAFEAAVAEATPAPVVPQAAPAAPATPVVAPAAVPQPPIVAAAATPVPTATPETAA